VKEVIKKLIWPLSKLLTEINHTKEKSEWFNKIWVQVHHAEFQQIGPQSLEK
jgi:hypothetical protein